MAAVMPWDDPSAQRVALAPDDLDAVVAVANALADTARPVTMRHFRTSDLVADNKDSAGFDPVTAADRAAERAMREVLAATRPDDGVVGEELGHTPGTSGLTWVIDPLDGTRAFMAGLPTWGTLVALFDGAEPVVGVVDHPVTDERWVGVAAPHRRSCHLHHAGTTREVGTRTTVGVPDAVLLTTFPEVGSDDERRAFERVRDRVRLTRYGADCYAYALVATGTADVVVEAGLAPWDVQAVVPVVRGAGGTITAWDGGPPHPGGRLLATGSEPLHADVMALLAD